MEELLERLKRIEMFTLIGAKDVFTVKEAAIYLGVSADRVYHLVSAKEIPCYKKNAKSVYFKKSELEDWMLQNRQMSNDEAEAIAERYCLTH